MPKILLHNLSNNYIDFHPRRFDFDQNGFFFAEDGDMLVTRSPIEIEYIKYLEKISGKKRKVNYIFSSKKHDTPFSIFEDEEIKEKVKKYQKQQSEGWTLDCYMLTEFEKKWAKELEIQVPFESFDYDYWDNKSLFRQILKTRDVRLPYGFENLSGGMDAVVAAAKVFGNGFGRIIVKQDEGGAGLNLKKMTISDFLKNLVYGKNLALDWCRIKPVRSKKFVIEGWYENVVLSPSVQFFIKENGQIHYISSHCQLFYSNKITYRGCLSHQWIPDAIKPRLVDIAQKMAEIFRNQGLRGYLSFNAIVLDNGSIVWTEVNPRRVMSSYPYRIVDFLGLDCSSQHYLFSRVQKNSWIGMKPKEFLSQSESFLYGLEKKRGIVPFDFGLLEDQGKLSLLSLGQNKTEVEDLFNSVLR